jgi:RNA polymerase sigma factor (sigma-70 family)
VTRPPRPRSVPPADPAAQSGDAGDPPNLDAIFREHARAVARWAARLGGPGLSVEDVVQDVFEIASRRLGDFRGDAKIGTWLFGITDRVIRNWRRRRRWRRLFSRLSDSAEETVAARQPTPVDELERRQAGARFYEILATLRPAYRSVLVLFEIEAMPAAQIADLLDLNVVQVRVRLHRARAQFLARMDKLDAREAGRPAR